MGDRDSDFLEMAKKIILINDPKGRVATAVKEAARTMECRRCCLILKTGSKELTIAEGTPEQGYVIGQKLSGHSGKQFLSQVIDMGMPVVIRNPRSNPNTAYMRELATEQNIHSVLYAPLFHAGTPLGVLVFDAAGEDKQRFTKADYPKITAVVELVAAAVARELASKKRKEELLRKESICALGEFSTAIMHTMRNHFTMIGGAAHRMHKLLLNGGAERREEVTKYAQMIAEGTERLESIVNNGLRFVTFSARRPKKTRRNLNEFLKGITAKFTASPENRHFALRFIPDRHLDEALVPFDRDMMEVCITDILRHSKEAKPGMIKVQTKLEPQSAQALIIVANNGERPDPLTVRDIFNPFMTIRAGSTGLATASAIVRAHGGETHLYPGVWTQFKLYLPLR